MTMTNNNSKGNQLVRSTRLIWGRALTRFCGIALILSSGVKFWHPAKAVAYMASMGYEGSTFFVIAVLELASGVLFLLPATRKLGLLLASSYLGGAIAAHLAIHRFFTGGPFLVYMAHHAYIGATIPGSLLVMAWLGPYLYQSDAQGISQASASTRYQSRPEFGEVVESIPSVG